MKNTLPQDAYPAPRPALDVAPYAKQTSYPASCASLMLDRELRRLVDTTSA